jgi:hypothetical protein
MFGQIFLEIELKMSLISFLVAAPHSYCGDPPTYGHKICDDASGPAARSLARALEHAPCSRSVDLIVNQSVLRSSCDLNRAICRDEQSFREPIRKTVARLRPSGRVAVLDVHSFPAIPNAWQNISFDSSKAELVVLDDFSRTSVERFVQWLRAQGVDAHYLRGDRNDIMNENHGLLLEYSEGLSTSRVDEISEWIAKGLCSELPDVFFV